MNVVSASTSHRRTRSMTNLDYRPPLSAARSARTRRAFEGIVASYIRDISVRGAR